MFSSSRSVSVKLLSSDSNEASIERLRTFFLSSLGVAVGEGAGLGDGELNKSSSSSTKSPDDFSRAGLDSYGKRRTSFT